MTATSAADSTKTATATITLNPPTVTVSVAPASVSLTSLASSQQFSATVAGSSNTAVTWSVSPQVGSISAAGVYTLPATVTTQQTVTIAATSAADSTTQAAAAVTLFPPLAVSVAPAAVGLTPSSPPQQFSATVTGASNIAVSWSISPQVGTISASGLYTPPAIVSAQQTVTVTATTPVTGSGAGTATITLSPPAPVTNQTLGTFQLAELFGVAWPDQPIEFRYDGGQPAPGAAKMIGPNGAEVPFQWVSSCSDATAVRGCIAVRSNLPAGANYTWTLQTGTPQAAPVNPVQIAQTGSNWEIKNGLTGVRIVTSSANPAPWNLAPIQGILLPNGTWTGAGSTPNFLYTESPNGYAGDVGVSLRTKAYSATGYSVTVTDSGPIKTVLKVTYTFNRPRYYYSTKTINTAGAGHYTLIVTMYANSKSILIDEDSDMQFSYYIPLYAQLTPNTMRLRGHGSNNSIPTACGYEQALPISGATNTRPIVITSSSSSLTRGQLISISGVAGDPAANGKFYVNTSGYPAGQFALYTDSNLTVPVAGTGAYGGGGTLKATYRGQSLIPAPDGYMDLTYSSDRPASYQCVDTSSYAKLAINYPVADGASGWYNMLYNAGAGTGAPVVGFYTGRESQQLYSAYGPSVPGVYTSNSHWISRTIDAGIQVDNFLQAPTQASTTLIHRNWALWVSTQADLLAPAAHQLIADDQNSLTGINLSHLYSYQLAYPDPPGGWKPLYLSPSANAQLISLVRDGTSLCGSPNCYYNLLYNSDGYSRTLLSMWQGNSAAAVQAALNPAVALAQRIMQTLATGDNHFDSTLGYYQVGLQTSPQIAMLNAILTDNNTTPAQAIVAKACLALFGSLFWDNDWFAIDNDSGDSRGLENQVQQYLQYRAQSAAAGASQPFLGTKVAQGVASSLNDFANNFSPTGAAAGSTHYQSAFFEPLILNYLNFTQTGALSMSDPRWAAYANWELSIQTPPEPRFGNVRKGYSNGDGNTEADVRPGMLATAIEAVNPTLAGNLMWAWKQNNSATLLTEDMLTMVAIDPTIPAIAPALGSINIPGYHTAERHAFGTPHETALWFINGGFYSTGGHRHADDGQVSLYAHSAPLAIDWNANLYSPETPGRFWHNSIVMDNELTHPWSNDNSSPYDAAALLQNPTNTEYAAFPDSTTSTATFNEADGTVWTRMARTMAFNPEYPIIYVYDSFAGASATAGKTLTWNLMATGPVTTTAGWIIPTTRFSAGCQSPAGQLPSNGAVNSLANGLDKFSFTGIKWAAHATGGINWDLFQIPSSGSAQFLIGNWGHGCHPSRESGEFQNANGAAFSESQDILRVHDTGPFTTLILPYRKTEAPVRTVTQQACGIQIAQAGETTCFSNSVATYTNGATSIVTVYDNSLQLAFGMTLLGGPQEVAVQTGQIVWTISGAQPGIRTLTLPGNWTASPSVPNIGPIYTYNYAGGLQAAPVTITFKQ